MKSTVQQLREIIQNVPVKTLRIVQDETLNETFIKQGSQGVRQLLEKAEQEKDPATPAKPEAAQEPVVLPIAPQAQSDPPAGPLSEAGKEEEGGHQAGDDEKIRIKNIHENKLLMQAEQNGYYILGQLTQDLSSMRVTLMVEDTTTGSKERTKIDLYERASVQNFAHQLAELFIQNPAQIESDLLLLTDLLEQYREKQAETTRPHYQSRRIYAAISPEAQKQCIAFLSQPGLISRIDQLIEKTGVVGEENTRKLLFIIASTYKMSQPLHALVQGSSGSGKSHLINSIGQCFPPEDLLSMTRVTSKSFYHYGKDELVDKLMLIQDYDGLDEEARYAFRELQSAGTISSSTICKDRYGNLTSAVKTVRSHFASLLATTKAEIYYDNLSRSIILGVDESEEQTQKIIEYQNKMLAGLIDETEQKQAKIFLQNCIRCIKPCEVVNRYADKVRLPAEAKMLRRLNSHYQAFVRQITILHQYQRQKDEMGRLIATPEDLQIACDLLLDAIIHKVDDLDSSLRQFFDRMKSYVQKQARSNPLEHQFTQRDIRLALKSSKTLCFRYLEDLEKSEYIQRAGGYANRGYRYRIIYWDDMQKIKTKIKQQLMQQLKQLPA